MHTADKSATIADLHMALQQCQSPMETAIAHKRAAAARYTAAGDFQRAAALAVDADALESLLRIGATVATNEWAGY